MSGGKTRVPVRGTNTCGGLLAIVLEYLSGDQWAGNQLGGRLGWKDTEDRSGTGHVGAAGLLECG